jgi:glycosyltransferase involved in cell wall biosynthesis
VRILIVNWRDFAHPWAGGGEVNIHEQAKRWVQWGHSVTMLAGGFPVRQPGAPKDTEVDGIKIIRRGSRYTVYLRAALHYLRHMRGQFDVVIDVSNGIPMLTPLYCRTPKVVLFHHIHLKQWFVEMPWPIAVVGWFLERFVVRVLYHGVPTVAISDSTRLGLHRIGMNPETVSVVRPALDRHDYEVSQAGAIPNRLVYLGRLRQYKRLDVLINVMKDLSVEFPDLTLDMVGVGEERPHLEDLARREGLQDRVVFHGFASHEDKVRILKQGWVFVMPSLNEGWGISVLEANACGVPAVAFDVPGLNESIRHEETGLLAKSYDEFRDSVRRLLRNPDERQLLAEGALNWSAKFDWDTTAHSLLSILGSACAQPQAAELPVPGDVPSARP